METQPLGSGSAKTYGLIMTRGSVSALVQQWSDPTPSWGSASEHELACPNPPKDLPNTNTTISATHASRSSPSGSRRAAGVVDQRPIAIDQTEFGPGFSLIGARND